MNRFLIAVTAILMVSYAVTAEVYSPKQEGRIFFNVANGTSLTTVFGTLLMALPALILPIILLVGLGAIAMSLFSRIGDDDYKRRSFKNATGISIDTILENLDHLPALVNQVANRYL